MNVYCWISCASCLFLASAPVEAQTKESLAAANGISSQYIMSHTKRLCRPKFAGREAGSAGARLAARYVAAELARVGLVPGGTAGTSEQTFKIRSGYSIQSQLSVQGGGAQIIARNGNYMPVHSPTGREQLVAGIVFAGYGISAPLLAYDDYSKVDVRGKAVVVFGGVPWSPETYSWLRQIGKQSYHSLMYKAQVAAEKGAALMLVVDAPHEWVGVLGLGGCELRLPDTRFPLMAKIPIVHVTAQTLVTLTGRQRKEWLRADTAIMRSRQPQSFLIRGRTIRYRAVISGAAHIGRNVIGVLVGSDRKLRNEAIVIGAHYDHLGEGVHGTYFGANDNAAGVAAMLEVARAFQRLRDRPKRTIIFVAFGAEEIGKLGSNHYIEKPSIPLKQTTLMLNFDMIGHNADNEINVVATRSSDQLHAIHQAVNKHVGLKLVHPENMRLGRSDHGPFHEEGIPVMYLFGGLHKEYNTPLDTPEKLKPQKLERVAKLAFLTTHYVAEMDGRLDFKD